MYPYYKGVQLTRALGRCAWGVLFWLLWGIAQPLSEDQKPPGFMSEAFFISLASFAPPLPLVLLQALVAV